MSALPAGLDRAELTCFCQFIGWSRSGTTLVGALLDAHPEILIGQELDAAARVLEGAGRDEVLSGIVERERAFARAGRRWNGYSYDVHEVVRDDLSGIRVIGDKKAAGTAEAVIRDDDALERLEELVGLPLRLIAVVRHPLDAVASLSAHLGTDLPPWHRPAGEPLDVALDWYLQLCDVVAEVASRRRGIDFIHLERLADDPGEVLRPVLEHLGVSAAPQRYFDRAASLLVPPRRARDDVEWTPAQLSRIESAIGTHGFLRPYSAAAPA